MPSRRTAIVAAVLTCGIPALAQRPPDIPQPLIDKLKADLKR